MTGNPIISAEQKLFEASFSRRHSQYTWGLCKAPNGDYIYLHAELAWQAWQAALASHAPSAQQIGTENCSCLCHQRTGGLRYYVHPEHCPLCETPSEAAAHSFEATVQPALNALPLESLKDMQAHVGARIRELEAAAQPTRKYERKQVPEETFADEIRLGKRKLCGHIAECDCQNGVFQAEIKHNDH